MSRDLTIVSNAFMACGILLGLPSLLAFVLLASASVGLRLGAPPSVPTASSSSSSLMDILLAMVGALGKGVGFFTDAAQWVSTLLAIVSFVLVMIALTMFFTGRGLHARRAWARIVGVLLSSGLLLVSALGVLVLRNVGRLAACLLAAAAVYALRTLWGRFA